MSFASLEKGMRRRRYDELYDALSTMLELSKTKTAIGYLAIAKKTGKAAMPRVRAQLHGPSIMLLYKVAPKRIKLCDLDYHALMVIKHLHWFPECPWHPLEALARAAD